MLQLFGTAPINGAACWRKGPDERGTFNILSVCILTLVLCAYSSLHLDIPRHGRTHWTHHMWRKTSWVCVALVAPEYVSQSAYPPCNPHSLPSKRSHSSPSDKCFLLDTWNIRSLTSRSISFQNHRQRLHTPSGVFYSLQDPK
jgi:hypothetical protein